MPIFPHTKANMPTVTASARTEIVQLEVGLAQNFCTLLCDLAAGVCAVVDPAFEVDRILRAARDRKLSIGAVLLTHGHLDHIEGVPQLLKQASLPNPPLVYIGEGEAETVASYLRSEGSDAKLQLLRGGETLGCGELAIEVLATPGHTRAGCSYFLPQLAALCSGDTLFVGSVGRPQRPETAAQLWHSLQQLDDLPEETRIYPGHNYGSTPTSTLGWERAHNPYLACTTAAAFVALCQRRL